MDEAKRLQLKGTVEAARTASNAAAKAYATRTDGDDASVRIFTAAVAALNAAKAAYAAYTARP